MDHVRQGVSTQTLRKTLTSLPTIHCDVITVYFWQLINFKLSVADM